MDAGLRRLDRVWLSVSVALTAAIAGVGCGAAPRPPGAPVVLTAAEIRPPPRHCTPTRVAGRLAVVVLGSGGERKWETKHQDRASSGFVVAVDGHPRVLVDAGTGSYARLSELSLDLKTLDTVLLTHMHQDHVGDFAAFVQGRDRALDHPEQPSTLRVFGPTGNDQHPGARVFVERVFGREGALSKPAGFTHATRIDGTDIDRTDHPVTVASDRAIVIKSISVDHGKTPALAYRIEHAGRSVVFSGDLAGKDDNLVELAKSADLLVQNAAVLDSPGRSGRGDQLHVTPKRTGQIAAVAPVAELLLTHMPNDVRLRQNELLDSIRTSYGGEVSFADDCMVVTVAD